MIQGLKNWHYLLAGTKDPIQVLSDHKNLTYWKDGHNIGRRVAQWMGILADYNILIEHHPGCYAQVLSVVEVGSLLAKDIM